MLLNFTLENWKSFRAPASFTMLAGKERRHSQRIPRVGKYPVRILPIAAMYGGNASGKSNFFQALGFAKQLIVNGVPPDAPDTPIPTHPFLLDGACATQPTRMAFEILADETIYEFSFAVSDSAVLEEKLVKITSTGGKTELYRRAGQKITITYAGKEEKPLESIKQHTYQNQLFITTATKSLNITLFQPVYRWFRDTLILIEPDAPFTQLEYLVDANHPLGAAVSDMIAQLDTGITRLHGENIPFSELPLPEKVKAGISAQIPEGHTRRVHVQQGRYEGNLRMFVAKHNGALTATRLVSYHQTASGKEVRFDLDKESSGTLRAIDLLPAFVMLSGAPKPQVYVIDELDRSMHTHLTSALLESYLLSCSPKSRSQLLFTTHDVQLIDQNLLRRDEMWLTERGSDGATDICSFGDFEQAQRDPDIRKSYLQGRLGGIPRIVRGLPFTNTRQESEAS